MKMTTKLLFMILWLYSSATFAEHLYISTGFTPPVSDYYRKVLAEIDSRLEDISISFEVLPAERSLALVNNGINDGDCCRIPPVVMKSYKNLLKVPGSFFTTRFSAFSKDKKLVIKSFNDLKPFSVAVPKGWKLIVNRLTSVNPRELYVVTTPEQLFRMLDSNRVEVGVVGYLSGLHLIRNLELQGIDAIEPPLVEKELYLMLHKKHKNLIPIFSHTINEMQNDGTIDKIYREFQ